MIEPHTHCASPAGFNSPSTICPQSVHFQTCVSANASHLLHLRFSVAGKSTTIPFLIITAASSDLGRGQAALLGLLNHLHALKAERVGELVETITGLLVEPKGGGDLTFHARSVARDAVRSQKDEQPARCFMKATITAPVRGISPGTMPGALLRQDSSLTWHGCFPSAPSPCRRRWKIHGAQRTAATLATL